MRTSFCRDCREMFTVPNPARWIEERCPACSAARRIAIRDAADRATKGGDDA